MGYRVVLLGLVAALTGLLASPAWATERRIPDGTRIPVRVMQQLSSASVRSNDPVTFAVVEDVVVDGDVVIKQGTPVRGVIVDAAEKRRMGRAGRLSYAVHETKAVDRTLIRLRAVQQGKGDSNVTSTAVTTTAVAVFVPVAAPFFLLRKGGDIVIPEGTRVDAFVDGDHAVHVGDDGTAVVTPIARGTGSAVTMTNADVLALHQAGFGDDVILAKIGKGTSAFSLEARELVALQKAGVSERVIAAMLSAK
jgi:tRNA pseudouridine-54 N-methylase